MYNCCWDYVGGWKCVGIWWFMWLRLCWVKCWIEMLWFMLLWMIWFLLLRMRIFWCVICWLIIDWYGYGLVMWLIECWLFGLKCGGMELLMFWWLGSGWLKLDNWGLSKLLMYFWVRMVLKCFIVWLIWLVIVCDLGWSIVINIFGCNYIY